jgi:hypothetical protein
MRQSPEKIGLEAAQLGHYHILICEYGNIVKY